MQGNNLRILRENSQLTQERLCDELKKMECYMTRSTYSKYETGIHNIPCDVLIKLAMFFETTTDYILNYK